MYAPRPRVGSGLCPRSRARASATSAGLVLYAIAVNGEQTTELQLTGYAICCIFFAAYVVCKSRPAWLGFDS